MLILWIYIALVLSILAYIALAFIRFNNVYDNRMRIISAIFIYHINCAQNGNEITVSYEDMESDNATCKRIWDWGCTRILPKEKFEIIKPYIGIRIPDCFGEPISDNGRAENGCEECPFVHGCDVHRKEMRHENH